MHRFKFPNKEFLLVFIGWVLLGVIILLFGRGMFESFGVWTFIGLYCKYFSFFLLLLYINDRFLLPRLFYENKKRLYFLIVLVLLVVVVFYFKPFELLIRNMRDITRPEWDSWMRMRDQWHNRLDSMDKMPFPRDMPPMMRPGNGQRFPSPMMGEGRHILEDRPDLVSLLIFLFMLGGGFAIESSKRLTQSEQRRLAAESEKTKSELSFLKAQVNPHFLFNTLNNIYSMALVQKKETPDAIMRLSNIMRYITETSNVELIGLSEELQFISDYIFLNKLKSGSGLDLFYEVKGDASGKEIPPLLLISFIENAFKYGISKRENSPIHIVIAITPETLDLTVENKIFKTTNTLKESTGMGIGNTRKRLETIFPGKYQLDIVPSENWFRVHLILPLTTPFSHED